MTTLMWRLAAGAALLVGLVLFYNWFTDYHQDIGDDRATARYELALAAQREVAGKMLADATKKAIEAERSLQEFKNERELKDAAAAKANLDQAARLRELAGPVGRLRDPNAPTGCGGCRYDTDGEAAAAAGHRPDDGAQAAGLLSGQLTALLLRLAAEADELNAAYASCRADAYAVRQK